MFWKKILGDEFENIYIKNIIYSKKNTLENMNIPGCVSRKENKKIFWLNISKHRKLDSFPSSRKTEAELSVS